MKRVFTLFLALLFILTSAAANSKEFSLYLSPNGNDHNKGDQKHPLLTLEAAQNMLRKSGKLGKVRCEVILQDGVYRLSDTFELTTEDSGSAEFPLTFKSQNRGGAIITRAQEYKLKWRPWRDGIYRAKFSSKGEVDQLFLNGKSQIMARYPNYEETTAKNNFRTIPFNGCAADAWDSSKAAGWSDPKGAYMHAAHISLWGDIHYEVTGKDANGDLTFVGGWQNNRVKNIEAVHKEYRMIENLLEELDAPKEWFYDQEEGYIYYLPEATTDMKSATIEVVFNDAREIIKITGENESPTAKLHIYGGNEVKDDFETPHLIEAVRHINIEGFLFTGAARSFMQNREPIQRSDWTIYRGGAVHLQGCENIDIYDCQFKELGGNALFVDGYNRNVSIRTSLFENNGATDVNFVGSPAAVRDPSFGFSRNRTMSSYDNIDQEIGPKTEDYPADCIVEDCLMTRCGRVEKQTAGVNISMSSRITVRHNTIYRVPRAAINVCDGTWGGHLIEWNSCFETVLETGDHGSYNSWGRDRFWFSANPNGPYHIEKDGVPSITKIINQRYPKMMYWDAYQTIILRNNLMICDHGWDIDLDDGSSNYEIYNNLCLGGGLKTREGYDRKVYNNIIFKQYTINVPYPAPTYDECERNILIGGSYVLSQTTKWNGKLDNNIFHNPSFKEAEPATAIQLMSEDDANSIVADAQFIDPENMDFRVKETSPALKLGFKNFPMQGFGVVSEHLKKLAPKPHYALPTKFIDNFVDKNRLKTLYACEIETLSTTSQQTAYGAPEVRGAILLSVSKLHYHQLADMGFKQNDIVLEIDSKKINTDQDLIDYFKNRKPSQKRISATVVRGQEITTILLKNLY